MLTAFLYEKGKPLTKEVSRAQMLAVLKRKDILLWIDLENPTEFECEALIEIFNFHPLAIEDCIADKSSPKIDDYEEYLFMVMNALYVTPEEELATSEMEIFLGPNYVVTFHRSAISGVEQVRTLVQKRPDTYLGRGSDILFHALLDRLVDNFMPLIDRYDHKIDELEEHIFTDPPADYLGTVLQVKHDMFTLRRIIAPIRDAVHFLIRTPSPFIRSNHLIYFRDIYDHLFRIYGLAEAFHEAVASVLQAYFSYSSNKLNEGMRRMTVMATLTMPFIIIASIYGMNFEHMPELSWKWGYPLSIVLSIGISVVMLVWMKLKKWI